MSTGGKLSEKEEQKRTVIERAVARKITNGEAGKMLGLSIRQIKRLKQKFRANGEVAIIHGLKAKKSNHAFSETVKQEALDLIEQKYRDFKPGFATEKLQEIHHMEITSQTIRIWMTEKGLWKKRKQKQIPYRSWRARKEYFGELQQFDGSYHFWFEDRYCDPNGNPIEVCLLASIDDATGEITKAVFDKHEGIVPVFTFWKGYVEEHGKPVGIYLDKFSTYKINHKAAVDNAELMTQFQRATQQLSIELIFANSPQAKGRIERLFQTLQDRLIKELRLAKIDNPTEGNIFLKEVFIPKFNQRFSYLPGKEGDVHRSLSETEKRHIDQMFSIHDTRRVNNDFTVQFKNKWYQLTEIQPTTVRPQDIVFIETWIDASIHIILKNHELTYTLLPEKPKKRRIKQPIILTTHRLNYKPPTNHPWRLAAKAGFEKKQLRG